MTTVLITGITGFIGKQVAADSFRKGRRVVGIGTRDAYIEEAQSYAKMRLPSEKLVNQIREWKPDICIHCAGSASVAASVSEPAQDFDSNVVATFNLLDAIRKNAPECRVIYLSSAATYGQPLELPVSELHSVNPISPYGYHKLLSEQICAEFHRTYGLRVAVARIFSAYGVGLRRQVVWDICQKICSSASNHLIYLNGTGKETRDFIYISDVVNALNIIMAQAAFCSETYNIASGESTSISEISHRLARLIAPNMDVKIVFNQQQRVGDPHYWQADISKLMGLGFRPEVSLQDGLAAYIKWIYTL